MRSIGLACLATTAVISAPAHADDTVRYGPTADWVEVTDGTKVDREEKTPLALLDIQQRIEGGTVTIYVDQAVRLDSPQALTGAGTSSLLWLPDKGNLTVHRVEILRGEETIDVLAGDARYSVLRRETNLEQRALDGMLTATMPVPGLRIGDILRISYTQTLKDETLKGNAQQVSPLLMEPFEASFGRIILSWPSDEEVRWKAGPDRIDAHEEMKGKYQFVSVELPLPKREDLPGDAPTRVTRGPIFQAGTFANWREVSQVFAPLYTVEDTVTPGGSLAAEIERIKSQTDDPLGQAALATELVQNKISYLLNGMAGGNYRPQAPEETWKTRYGDCKAKSLLLLAILDGLGIEAEPVLVSARAGDAVPDTLPMPAAFDHVIVRATIGGVSYWLDGTSAGTRLASIADTPDFRFYLPISTDGADLQEIEPRVPSVPSIDLDIVLDQRGGVDLPTIADVTARFSGPMASQYDAIFKQASAEQLEDFYDNFASSQFRGANVIDGDFAYDEASGIATVHYSSIFTSPWQADGERKRQRLTSLPSSNINFNADRSRPAWREIPVNLGGPTLEKYDLTVRLPEGEPGYLLRGKAQTDLEYAGRRVVRTVELGGNVLTAHERHESTGGELRAAEIPAAKARAQRLKNSAPFLTAPANAARSWEYGKSALRKRLKPLEEAYQVVIDRDPDEARPYLNRASFRFGTTDFKGALTDYTKAIELDPVAENYTARADTRYSLGDLEGAIADARKAFEVSPSADFAMYLARLLGENGDSDEAMALIEEFDDYGENHENFVHTRADILAYAGRADEGLADIDALIEERPGQAYLYNASCWYRARFSVGFDQMIDVCNRAVSQGSSAAAALDSRALAWLRLGEPDKALADANAAVALVPQLRQARYLRAFIQRELGDRSAASDLSYLSRTFPGMSKEYAQYGLEP